jgi:ribosome maturation factor RimP
MKEVERQLWELVAPFLAAEGVELDDLDVRGGGKGRMVRVLVDADGGVDVDRIAELARGLSRLLDESDPVAGSYTLEVGSPGLERTLRRPEHYRKSVGREVVVKTRQPIDGAQSHRGILESFTDAGATLRVDDADRLITLDQVTEARTVFRWEKAPKPGRK